MKKIYLAIPYTWMEENAFHESTEIAKYIIETYDYLVFSPITHFYPIEQKWLDWNWEYWEKILYEFIEFCDEIWIVVPSKWIEKIQNSTWVQAELRIWKKLQKEISYIDYHTKEITKK